MKAFAICRYGKNLHQRMEPSIKVRAGEKSVIIKTHMKGYNDQPSWRPVIDKLLEWANKNLPSECFENGKPVLCVYIPQDDYSQYRSLWREDGSKNPRDLLSELRHKYSDKIVWLSEPYESWDHFGFQVKESYETVQEGGKRPTVEKCLLRFKGKFGEPCKIYWSDEIPVSVKGTNPPPLYCGEPLDLPEDGLGKVVETDSDNWCDYKKYRNSLGQTFKETKSRMNRIRYYTEV